MTRAESDPGRAAPDPEIDQHAVRPYVITSGRTRPELTLSGDAMVWTTAVGAASLADHSATDEERAAMELCTSPRSVREVAALLGLPIGVSRILVSDLAQQQAVTVHNPAPDVDVAVIHRLLKKLRTL
jgi:Protein of unknown function (DUF742)